MERINLKAGDELHTGSEIVKSLDYILLGKIEIISPVFQVTAGHGVVLGIFEHVGEPYQYRYVVKEDCTLDRYPFRRKSDVDAIVHDHSDECDLLVSAGAALTLNILGQYQRTRRRMETFRKTLVRSYNEDRNLCAKYNLEIQPWPLAEESEPFQPERELPERMGDYYDQLGLMPQDVKKAFYSTHTSLTTAAILDAVHHIFMIRGLFDQLESYTSELREQYLQSADLYDLYRNLYLRNAAANAALASEINEAIRNYHRALVRSGLIPEDHLDLRQTHYENAVSAISVDFSAGLEPDPEEAGSKTAEEDHTAPEENDRIAEALLTEVRTSEEKTETPDIFAPLENSLETILAYTSLDESEEDRFRQLMNDYRELQDKNSREESVRELRKEITKYFFHLYENAALTALESTRKPPLPVQLFLHFGYMDETLVGREHALILLKLLLRIHAPENASASGHIYTMFEWLAAISRGEKEPSRNDFDQDFPTFLKIRRQDGLITEDQEKRYLVSPKEKMRFELNNFFAMGMKMVASRPITFCPVLSSHNIIRSLMDQLVTKPQIEQGWDRLRSIDYSLFYREALFQAPSSGIPRESILLEVLPDVILLPALGARGGLWQEISGVRRDTPARMFLPILLTENLETIQIRLAGQFRWQICKRVQGARWNDLSELSLTAGYVDYLQFYRKNSDLSSEAKEKIKTEITACRNSFENVFILDYMQWIRYESQGSPRLNKVAKQLMFQYCPFAETIRRKLEANAMYASMIHRHEAKAEKQFKVLTSKYRKYRKDTETLPQEIENYIAYYKR